MILLPLMLVASLQEPEPRLVVLISIDQLVPGQLERLEPGLGGGLARLWREGLVMDQARLPYSATETGPGHATLATGCVPSSHGVTGNTFFDRGSRSWGYCVGDESQVPVPEEASGGKVSPANLRVPTLGDYLCSNDPRARVFSVAGKDRSAVCMGGRHAEPALWWDRKHGGFSSSSSYCEVLPAFVAEWNTTWVEQAGGWSWGWSSELSPEDLGAAADERAGEAPFQGQDTVLPHQLDGEGKSLPGQVFQTPLVDSFVLQVASRAVEELELGADDAVDLLAIGLSGCDVVGHGFGPLSHEVTDLLLRVDLGLGTLFEQLDERVGKGRWIAALSADHGVLPLPEHFEGGRRITRDETGELDRIISEALAERWPDDSPRAKAYGSSYTLLAEGSFDPSEARQIVARAAAKADWVAAAYTYDQLAGAAAPPEPVDPYWTSFQASFDAERCADVVLRLVPGAIRSSVILSNLGTTHGSTYDYDQRIPLLFLGPGFPAEHRSTASSSADVVPTLLGRLGLAAPGLEGRDLSRL